MILTNGEIDAVAGPAVDARRLAIHDLRPPKVLSILKANSIFNVLSEKNVRRQPIEVDGPFEPTLPDGSPSGIEILPFAVPGKSAWYLEGRPHPGGDMAAATRSGFGSGTRRRASISISSPPAPA